MTVPSLSIRPDIDPPSSDYDGRYLMPRLRELRLIDSLHSILSFDQQCFLPADQAAGVARGHQLEWIESQLHQRSLDPELERLVDALYEQRETRCPTDARIITLLKTQLDRRRRLSESFVSERTKLVCASSLAWEQARPRSDFAAVLPFLRKLQDSWRRESDLIGYSGHPYDVHLQEYEPGLTTEQLEPLLVELADGLRPLVPAIGAKYPPTDIRPVGSLTDDQQMAISRKLLERLGFDFSRGAMHRAAHPFCNSLSPDDIRIATRPEPDPLLMAYSAVHEFGHALYRLGLPKDFADTPICTVASVGADESLSRLWEAIIGHDRPFCKILCELFQEHAPGACRGLTPETVWRHVNSVRPSLIRVDADEVTYNLHVVLRFILERELVGGELDCAQLPDRWAELSESYLGIHPEKDSDGVLQDCHWFADYFGYFPSYALGNIYSVLIMNSIRGSLPDVDSQIAVGDFSELSDWLNAKIHSQGHRYDAADLIQRVSGAEPSVKPFLAYLRAKFEV